MPYIRMPVRARRALYTISTLYVDFTYAVHTPFVRLTCSQRRPFVVCFTYTLHTPYVRLTCTLSTPCVRPYALYVRVTYAARQTVVTSDSGLSWKKKNISYVCPYALRELCTPYVDLYVLRTYTLRTANVDCCSNYNDLRTPQGRPL